MRVSPVGPRLDNSRVGSRILRTGAESYSVKLEQEADYVGLYVMARFLAIEMAIAEIKEKQAAGLPLVPEMKPVLP